MQPKLQSDMLFYWADWSAECNHCLCKVFDIRNSNCNKRAIKYIVKFRIEPKIMHTYTFRYLDTTKH